MANKNAGIHVTGIPELTRALKATDAEALKRLKVAMKAIAQHVIRKAEGRGAPGGILKPRATQKGAGIAFPRGGPGSGGERDAFYPWLDFGGGNPIGRGVRATTGGVGARRRVIPEGRYVYPAIGSSKGYIEDRAYEAITEAAKANGFEVRG
jgi:hypothetical protein